VKANLPAIEINPAKIKSLGGAKKAIDRLINAFEELASQVRKLIAENERLKRENERLRKQSKKPLFDKKAKSQDYSASKKLERKSSSWRKSRKKKKIKINSQVRLEETETCSCGSQKFTLIRTWEKIVQGIEIRRNNIKYLGRDKKCLHCGKIHRSIIPENIRDKEFDSNLTAWVSVLKHDCRFSQLLIHKFLTSLGIIISRGQIDNILLENSKKLEDPYSCLRFQGIKRSQYLNSDATGFKRRTPDGKFINQHLHFAGHQFLSLFKITRKYNSATLANRVLGKQAEDKLYISDDASANGQRLLVDKKQLCWLHEIRHFLKLEPQVKINKQRLDKIISQLWEFYHQCQHYSRDPTKKKKNSLKKQFKFITSQKTGYDKLDRRLILTGRKEDRLLLFLNYPGLPIQNNLAERDLRPAVIIRKLSGGTKSKKGDRSFERHMSIIQTARKQGLNVFETLHGFLTNQLNPATLTVKTTPHIRHFT